MNHASLFSGIGGFDEAAEWMGWDNLFHCDNNRWVQYILKYYWPNAISYGDIKQTDFTIWRGLIDVLTGGFPCQPYSTAGKRLGKKDARHLWPEMLRAIREIRPRWVVGENVLGLVNWNGGLVFEEVQADLEAEGYEVQPFVLPAAGVGAPHKRYRVFFVAYRADAGIESMQRERENSVYEFKATANPNISGSQRREEQTSRQKSIIRDDWRTSANTNISGENSIGEHNSENSREKVKGSWADDNAVVSNGNGSPWDATNSIVQRLQERVRSRIRGDVQAHGPSTWSKSSRTYSKEYWQEFPTVSPVCSRNDGVSYRLDSAALLNGRTPKQPWRAFAKWRAESVKAGGNAVVPQVVYQIFKAIEQYEKQTHSKEV